MALAGSIVRYRPRREVVGRFRADKNGVTVRMKTRRLQRMVDEWMQRDVATPSSPPEGAPEEAGGKIVDYVAIGNARDSTEDDLRFFRSMLMNLGMFYPDLWIEA